MLRHFIIISFLICTKIFAQHQRFPDNFKAEYYFYSDTLKEGIDIVPQTFVVKIKDEYRHLCINNAISIPALQPIFQLAGVTSIKKIYPNHQPPKFRFNSLGEKLTDLSLIYDIEFSNSVPVLSIVHQLNASGVVEYAQPRTIEQPLTDLHLNYLPNDPSVQTQWNLYKIKAIDVWDSIQGDTTVVIGMVDGGTNFSHPDLLTNIKYNYADPLDGIDNDNDGYVDNFRGWDIGDNDNNPQYIATYNSAHGTAMSGVAAASTDNGIGIAGVAFNCKYLSVKMVSSAAGWTRGYEGIVYAADHGADVISCSWGSNSPGPYKEDVLRYATVNMNKQVVAACGNSNNSVPVYPAAYDYVLSVASSTNTDMKSPTSSFYDEVDISSPAYQIPIIYGSGYGTGGGTSEAAAQTSGSIALIKSFFPNLQPRQVGALIQQTSDVIDTIALNIAYQNKIGYGRINLWNAITASHRPFINMSSRNYSDGVDDIFLINDTANLSGTFFNYLSNSSTNLTAKISHSSQYIQLIDSVIQIGILNELQSNAPIDEFRFRVLPACPVNQVVTLKISYYDNGFLNHQYIQVFVNPSFYNLDKNGLTTSITSTGRIGYNSNNSSQGVGFRRGDGPNQLLQLYFNPMGFWIGNQNKVSNQTLTNPLGPCCPLANDQHFIALENIQRVIPATISDIELKSRYNDSGAGVNALQVEVSQHTWMWNSQPQDSNFIVLQYMIENKSISPLQNLYAGIFSDFDALDSIYQFTPNIAYYDTLHQIGIIHNPNGNDWIGVQLLNNISPAYFANNSDGSNGSANVYNGFTQAEKFMMMSGGILRPVSDLTDITQYIGYTIDSLAAQSCTAIHFALLVASSYNELIAASVSAKNKYQTLINVWTGSYSNNWHDSQNWSQQAVPGVEDYVLIPSMTSSSVYQPVISTQDGYVKHLEVLCGGNLQVINNRKLFVGY